MKAAVNRKLCVALRLVPCLSLWCLLIWRIPLFYLMWSQLFFLHFLLLIAFLLRAGLFFFFSSICLVLCFPSLFSLSGSMETLCCTSVSSPRLSLCTLLATRLLIISLFFPFLSPHCACLACRTVVCAVHDFCLNSTEAPVFKHLLLLLLLWKNRIKVSSK